ncbi:uncharacterized protein ISCGN_017711 [Ixodes scapularis]
MAEGEQAAAPAIRTGSIPYRQRDPPTFAGFGSDDVDEWLCTFERVSVHNAWDNTHKLANVVFYLRDTAKVWFDNHEEQIVSWDAFKTRLSDVFGCPVSRKENATQRLATRDQSSGEPITTYVEDILALCKRVNPTMSEMEKVENIMKGIAEDAFAVLVSRNPTTVAQLQEECQRWEGHRSRRIASPSTVSRLQNCVASSGPPLTGDIKNIIRQIIKEELAVLFTPSRRDLQSEPVDLSPEGIRTLIRNELAQSAPSSQETICAASPAHACGTPNCFQADYNPRFVQSSERPWLRQFSSPPATRRPMFFYCGIPALEVDTRTRINEAVLIGYNTLDILQGNNMNSVLFGIFFACCTAFAAPSTRKAEDAIAIDVVLDEEAKRVGEEAQLVGKILCNVAQGWKETAQKANVPADEFSSEMKLLLPFLLAGLLTVTCGASIEPVETTKPEEVAEEAEEYRWRRKVGETLERVGKWLQGKYSAATEEEELEMALLIAELEQPDVSGKDILSEHDDEVGEVDEVEDEVVPYGLRKKFSKWRKKIVDAGKKVATAVVINKAAGAVVAATG